MREWSHETVPRTMSTQHPDNARKPEWCEKDVLEGDDEVYEAFFAYSKLGCKEVMWDSEGKDVDMHVVRKLLSYYEDFFKYCVLGEDLFLTYRIPNPRKEAAERKVAAETLLNVTVGHDVASAFYGKEATPIFEVILPFTTSSEELASIHEYYRALVNITEARHIELADHIGPFKPKEINVIPLIEDMESLLSIDSIVSPYVRKYKKRGIRVFIARSDPALNYGLVCATLIAKIALSKLKKLEEGEGCEVYPIIGVGMLPFRGHLSPQILKDFLNEYRGVYTATVQSALKYDFIFEESKVMVDELNRLLPHKEAVELELEENLVEVLRKFRSSYREVVELLSPLINTIATYVPSRRARKLHIGLFGYSRGLGEVKLPRAIPFTCALYSIGIPPEFIGFRALSKLKEGEWRVLEGSYLNLKPDLSEAAGYVSFRNLSLLRDEVERLAERVSMSKEVLKKALDMIEEDLTTVREMLGIKLGSRSYREKCHENFVNSLLLSFMEGEGGSVKKYLLEAALIRRSLG